MTTCEISKEIEFDAGHRVARHAGKCAHPHGHRYLLRATCRGDVINDPSRADHGMLVDFGALKQLLGFVADRWDHRFLVERSDPLAEILAGADPDGTVICALTPTAENLARMAWDMIEPEMRRHFPTSLRLITVSVRETPTSWAHYYGDHL